MSFVLPDPRPGGHMSPYAAFALALIAIVVLAVLSLSGPRAMERFAQGAFYCRPFVGQTPYC
jgi:hypothetical protein